MIKGCKNGVVVWSMSHDWAWIKFPAERRISSVLKVFIICIFFRIYSLIFAHCRYFLPKLMKNHKLHVTLGDSGMALHLIFQLIIPCVSYRTFWKEQITLFSHTAYFWNFRRLQELKKNKKFFFLPSFIFLEIECCMSCGNANWSECQKILL